MFSKVSLNGAAFTGAVTTVALLIFTFLGSGPSLGSQDATRCDYLAADPLAHDLPDGVTGVVYEQLDADDAIAACTSAVASQSDSPRTHYQLGRALYKAKRYEEAARRLNQACDLEYPAGCSLLGGLYMKVRGFQRSAKDLKRAAFYYEKACDLGEGTDCNNLGRLHAKGTGVSKNLKRAASFYEKACDLGEGIGCYNLGRMTHSIGRKFFEFESSFISRLSKAFQKGCDLAYGPSCGEFARVSRTPFHYTRVVI